MTELHHLLKLKADTPKEIVKMKYNQLLYKLHPTNRDSGDEKAFIELQEAYKQYLTGDSHLNCFAIIENTIHEFRCRCGGKYTIKPKYIGRIECDFCSCFIEVEDSAFSLSTAGK